MAKTKLAHRAFALSLATLFLVTSLGFSFVVIWQLVHRPKTPPTNPETSEQQEVDRLEGKPLSGFTPIAKIDQIKTIDLKSGNGVAVKRGATITVHYTGAIAASGNVFESSYDSGSPATFTVESGPGKLIEGWVIGVTGMKIGGKRRVLIPATLGYGATGSPPKIGPNTDLVFDIELISVKNP